MDVRTVAIYREIMSARLRCMADERGTPDVVYLGPDKWQELVRAAEGDRPFHSEPGTLGEMAVFGMAVRRTSTPGVVQAAQRGLLPVEPRNPPPRDAREWACPRCGNDILFHCTCAREARKEPRPLRGITL
jgi:hypothetical protein